MGYVHHPFSDEVVPHYPKQRPMYEFTDTELAKIDDADTAHVDCIVTKEIPVLSPTDFLARHFPG